MLPTIRHDEYLYPVPKLDIDRQDVENFMTELSGYNDHFADCFQRSESREHLSKYMAGKFCSLERKSIEPIALALEDGNVRAMQRFISDTSWDSEKMITKYRSLVNTDLGHPDGALIFDESGFIKKGQDSVGVARQYSGAAGKVENCQVGVFAAYVSEQGYSLVDKRLFIPENWFGENFLERRTKCLLPPETVFKTKPQLAVEMLHVITQEDILPYKYVLADSVYGVSPDFIRAVEALPDKTYFVSIPKTTLCWSKEPVSITKTYQWGGKTRTKTTLVDPGSKPISVDKLVRNINDYFWYRRTVSEGSKGPIVYEFTRCRITLAAEGIPIKTVWLLVRRAVDDKSRYDFFISNAPVNTKLKTFVWLSGLRWAIEQCFEETKSDLGLDHYEVRKFPGWHHHMLTTMMAHFFLWHLKIRLGKKSTIYYDIAA